MAESQTTQTWICEDCGKPSTAGTFCTECNEKRTDEFLAMYERIKHEVENDRQR